MFNLNTPLKEIGRVGSTINKKLKSLGLITVHDLIYHFPFRYDDYSKIFSISEIKTKKSGTIKGRIDLISNHRSPRKKMIITQAIVSDETDSIKVVWFNQPFLAKVLKPGTQVYLAGKIEESEEYGLQFLNPSYEICKKREPIHAARLVPIYATTSNLTQKQIRYLVREVLPLAQNIDDWLPRAIRAKYNLTNLSFALAQIHFPEGKKWLERATHRLKFDELFLIQARNQIVRKKLKSRIAPIINFKQVETKEFVKSLPFQLTNSQRKCAWEIINDLAKASPTNRLLEGDVGSGKTVVAVLGILNVLLNNHQVAYMAPTEILAQQHFKNISEFFKNFSFKIALVTREDILTTTKYEKFTKVRKKEVLKKISEGKINLIIGTHALIQEGVKFKNLALAIVDEQHRFGVAQRAELIKNAGLKADKDLGSRASPHFLSMTATPIPRSYALTIYGDLDLSIIDEMPPGRKEVITKIIPPKERKKVYQFARDEIKKGRQIFVICPLIDPSDRLGVKSVKEEYERLAKKIFSDLKVACLHGKLKAEEKEKIMKKFVENKINILISTTVVEVGIDIPNASTMVIEGSERFGLAQLYQLRGRIGRSKYQSCCFLFLEKPRDKARERLKALLTAKNGFQLAEKDLEMRGPGEVFGTQQSGFLSDLKIARLSDVIIIKEAHESVNQIFDRPEILKNWPLLKEKIDQFTKLAHLE